MSVNYVSNQFISTHISGTYDNVSSTNFTYKIRTSVDGNVWTERLSIPWSETSGATGPGSFTYNYNATFWNNTFVAWMNVANNNNSPYTVTNRLLFSSDGITWAERHSFGNGNLSLSRLKDTLVVGLHTMTAPSTTDVRILNSVDEGYTWTERYYQQFNGGAYINLQTNNEDALVGVIGLSWQNSGVGTFTTKFLYSSDTVAWSSPYNDVTITGAGNVWVGNVNPYFGARIFVDNNGTRTVKILFAPNGNDWAEAYSETSTANYSLMLANRNNNFIAFGNVAGTPSQGVVWKYTPAFTVWTSGAVRDSNQAPVAGATVSLVGTPSTNTVTGADGRYKLTGIPSGVPYTIKISKGGYWDTYYVPSPVPPGAPDFTVNMPINGTLYLYTDAQMTEWGATTDKGAIITRTIDALGGNTGSIGGVMVTATNQSQAPYAVQYMDALGNFGGSATYPIGRVFILNITAGDNVTVTPSKVGWNFIPETKSVYAKGVTLGTLSGIPVAMTGQTPGPGYSVSGVVLSVGPPRMPLADAHVIITDQGTGIEVSRPRTNEYGYYMVDLLATGWYDVRAVRNGYVSDTQPQIVCLGDAALCGLQPITGANASFLMEVAESPGFPLAQGWNFVSFPKVPVNADIATVMANSPNVVIVWGYDGAAQAWRKWVPGGGQANTLSAIEVGKGYWIYASAADGINMSGWTVPTSTLVNLNEQWNLLGYLGPDNALATTELDLISGKWSIVWNWTGGVWYGKHISITTLPAPIGPLTNFNQGKAYWVKIKQGQATGGWTQ